jgi:hypothetical protein
MRRFLLLLLTALALTAAGAHAGQGEALPRDQAMLAARMGEVEQRLLEMARLMEPDQPERARQLREALRLSREGFIVAGMESAGNMLDAGRYEEAVRLQQAALEELTRLAAALSLDRGEDLERLSAAARRLERLVQKQREATDRAGSMFGLEAFRQAAAEQARLMDEARLLLAELAGGPGSEPLTEAVARMVDAQAALTDGEGARAAGAQAEAASKLDLALAAVLDAIARLQAQRRAELLRKVRGLLEGMLDGQRQVRLDTEAAGRLSAQEGPESRAWRLRTGDLAARQERLAQVPQQAFDLVAAEPALLALPVALRQLKDDALAVAGQLRGGLTGPPVQAAQQGIEAELQALIEALREAEVLSLRQPTEAPPPPSAGEPTRRSPVELLGELRVARALQAALQRRTAGADAMREPGGPLWAEGRRLAEELAGRQAEVTGIVAGLIEAVRPEGP